MTYELQWQLLSGPKLYVWREHDGLSRRKAVACSLGPIHLFWDLFDALETRLVQPLYAVANLAELCRLPW
jgi:hypothetical protein